MSNEFPSSLIICWLREKVLKNKDFLPHLINLNNYSAIEQKYRSQMNIQIPEYRRLEIVHFIWNELQLLSKISMDKKTQEYASKLILHLRNQFLIERRYNEQKQNVFNYKSFDESNQTMCPICYENYTSSDTIIITPCKHEFHLFCLELWLSKNNSCPLCRTDF